MTKLTKEGTTLGTVAYMSPEQASGDKVDHRSDIWSLGVLLYEMITGQLPFKGEYEQAIMYTIMNENPESVTGLRSNIPLELDIIINKLLSKDVSERYQNLDELIVDLKRVKKNLSSGEKELVSLKKTRPVFKKSAFAAIVVLILVTISYFLIIKKEITTKPDIQKPIKRKVATQTVWKNSIAVLPFVDMSPKKDQEYFCDGMTEQIITNLSRVPDLKVIARTSVMVYKNSPKDIRQISRELGVKYVMEGSVRKSGKKLRVTAQLINAENGFHIWAQDYDRNLSNIFEIQDNVSQSITAALEGTVIRHKGKKASPYPANIQAYDWYLKALYHIENVYLKSRSEDDFQKAVEMVHKAIELDPDWAQNYVTMAYIYENHWVVTGDAIDLKKEKEYALKACEIDPESPSANASLALQILREGDYETAFSYITKALSINPNSSTVLHIMAMFYENIGLQDYALRFVLKAVELNPLYIYSINHMGWHSLAAGNVDQATAYFEKALKLQSEFVPSLNGYAFTLLLKNEIQAAQEILDRARVLLGKVDFHFNRIQALAYACMGRKEAALKMSKSAIVYVALGEYEKALTFLEQIRNTAPLATTLFYSYPGLKNLPIYDPIREHPRFKDVVEKRRQHYNRLVEKYPVPGHFKKSQNHL